MTTPAQKVYENYLAPNVQADPRWDASKKYVWAPDPEQCYVKAEVTGTSGDNYKVLTIHGEEREVKKALCEDVNPPIYDGVQDNSDLPNLSEAAVLHNLRLRYADNRIHTYSGLFLVIINPYKNLPIYTDDIIALYNGKRRVDIAPHVYTVADEAYRAMRDGKNQSILITGESGAGKTVNTKKVIQYLATIAGRRGSAGQLEDQILNANPILESFGNAKTTRNDNSSRFGKFIQVQFSKSGFIAGAVIDHYLLEKSRVCKQAKDERNYHIFYQLFAGSTPAQKEQMQLGSIQDYPYASGGNCFSIEDVDDGADFGALKKSMDTMQISTEDQEAIFRIVAGVLHLGNLSFGQNSSDESFVKDAKNLEKACALLRVTPESLQFSLTKKKIKAPGQTIVANLNQEQASFSRDALAKALYDRMFDWLVKRINKSIDNDAKKANYIGVLDIAGFEIFEDNNSFEQLCINYTNEKLQQFFNHHMFKLEQDEYLKEKIVWDLIDFGLDLQDCIDLIEKPGCILALLDEECVFPKATDTTFLQKLDAKFASHKNYEKTRLSKSGAGLFGIKHYAGKVTYNVNQWLTKNMNPLGDDIVESMQSSLDPFLQSLFWVERSKQITANKKAAQFITISTLYKGQLFTLMSTLASTDPHFVRCIKPNPAKKPGIIHSGEVLDQLHCNGVCEGIRIARKGYPSRLIFEDFKKRYALLAANKLPADPRASCEAILNIVKADTTQYQIGRTKLFFRAGYLSHLERLRENKQADSAKIIQRSYRKHLFRMRLARRKEEKTSAARIQRNIRAWINRKNAKWTKLYKGIKPLIQPNRVEQELKTTKHELDKMTEAKNQLESANKTLEDDIKSTKVQLESAFKDRERLQETKNNLEGELNDTKEKLAYERSTSMARNTKQEALISELTGKLSTETTNVSNLEKVKKGLEGQIQELQTQLTEETSAKNSLEATRKKQAGDIENLTTRLEAEEKEKGELQRAKKKVDNELEDLKAQLAAEKKKNAELERQVLALRADLEQAKADIEKLTAAKTQLENQKKQLDAKIADLSEQVESTEKGKTGVEEAKKKLSREVQEMQDQLEAERANVTKSEDNARQLQSRLDEVQIKFNKEAEARTASNKANEALQKEIATLKEQLEAELAAKDNVQKNLKKTTTDYDEIKQKLEAEERSRNTAEQTRKRVEGDIKTIQAQLEAAVKAKTAAEDASRALQSDLDELRDQLEFEGKAKAGLEKQRKQLEGRVEELREELEAKSAGAEKSSQTLRRELDLIREELEAEVDQKKRLETLNHDLEASVAELKKKADAVDKAQVEEMKKNFNAQLAALQGRVAEEEAAKVKFDNEAKKLKNDIKALETRLETEGNEKAQAEKLNKKTENDVRTLTGQLDGERKARAEKEAAIKKLETQIAEQAGEYDTLAKAKATIERQLKTAQAELEEARKQAEDEEKSKKRAVADLQAQLRDANEALDDETESRKKVEDARKQLEAEIATIKKNLANADASAKAEEAKRVLQAEIDKLKLEAEEATKAKVRVEKELAKAKDEVIAALAAKEESENQKRKIQKSVQLAEAKAEEERAAAAKVQGSISKLQQEAAAAKARADEEAAERAKAATTIKALQAKIAQIEADHGEAETASSTLKAKVKSLEQALTEARKDADSEGDLRSRLESELKNVRAELDELRESTEAGSSNASRYERQWKAAQRQVSELEEQLQLAQDKTKEETTKLKKKMQEQIDDLNSQLEKEVRAKSTASRQQRMLQRELDDTKARLEKLLQE